MKLKYLAAVFAVMLYQGTASAETIMGTITNVDNAGKKVTILRTDTNQSVTMNVSDASQLSSLRAGSQINVDANNKSGTWEVRRFNPTPTGNSLSASTSVSGDSLSSNTASSATTPSSGRLASSGNMANSASVNGAANSGLSASGSGTTSSGASSTGSTGAGSASGR